MDFKIVFALISLVSMASGQNFNRPVSRACDAAMLTCSQRTLTTGKCRSLYRGTLLNQNRNDEDNSCTVNGTDFLFDVTTYYDPNGDGQMCLDEWNARRTNAFGLDAAYTTAEFNSFNQGCAPVNNLGNAPASDLRDAFLGNQIRRALSICGTSNNIQSLPTCFGLPMICKHWQTGRPECSNFPSTNAYKTLSDKLTLNRLTNDANNDGTVTPQEISNDLNNSYDVDNNGVVTQAEWVNRWTSYYGFTVQYANWVYNVIAGAAPSFPVSAQVPDASSPASQFPAFNLEQISAMCENDPSLYDTNNDCAQLSETCQVYYPNDPTCAQYIGEDNCGIPAYIKCINTLKSSGQACNSQNDQSQVDLEVARSNNRLSPMCVPNSQNPQDKCEPCSNDEIPVPTLCESGAAQLTNTFTFVLVLLVFLFHIQW